MITDSFQFFTQSMVNVTNNIKEGKTAAFKERKEAEDHARQKGSYVYDLLCQSVKGNDEKVKIYGYAVPN
ncbi:hypothetical protein [Christiangramia fulva]|uniref:hypothetical protein n=1 Tax=Christiangramia fulva TaxID=2126553 RepID=UPI00131CBA72|nr:hypothetical protein [Christiangramia fulva]